MRFGDCLAELTKERGWARSELVHALRREGVNSSLVYRWLRNERTPKLYSGDRERIAACLRLSQGDYERLRQAQVESLEGRENPSKASAIQEIQPPSASTGYRQGPQPNSDPTHNGQLHAKRLVQGAIRGQDAVLETAIALIEAAPAPPSPSRRGILLTHMGRGVIDPFGDQLTWWLRTLRNALQNGYDVSHLATIEGTAAWSQHMVQHLLRLTGSVGSYQPRYFLQYGSLQHPFEMLIVPEVGAMIALSTGHDRQVDSALLLKDPQEVELLRAHFGALANDTRPLTNVFSTPEDKHRFVDTLLQVEEREGETFLAAGGPCLHTAPYSWFQEGSTWARNLRAWGVTDPPWMIGVQKRRVDAFLHNVGSYRHCDIYPKSAVVRLAMEGKSGHRAPYTSVPREDRLLQLENMIALLRTFDKYELALLNESEEKDPVVTGFLEVKHGITGEDAVLMEGWSLNDDGEQGQECIEILEPTMCAALRHYVVDFFEHRTSPPSSDKREVIQFLETQIRRIREQSPDV